jgi:hypothetical protein
MYIGLCAHLPNMLWPSESDVTSSSTRCDEPCFFLRIPSSGVTSSPERCDEPVKLV